MYAYTCTHVGTSIYTHTCTHTHHDAWARVRTDNLAKDTGGDRACAHVGVPMCTATQTQAWGLNNQIQAKLHTRCATSLYYTHSSLT